MIKYRPEIDGLRTLAVLPVILFHLGFSWMSSGYLGVDVFFVISGFLITSIITKELNANDFSFKKFWLKRVKRIMPALLFMVLSVLVIFPFLIFKGDINYLITDAIAAIFSYANFNAWLNFGDYWGNRAESSFFLHCWSLSLEEQFYLFYPVILFIAFKKKYSPSIILGSILLLSFLLFVIGVIKFPSPTFYMLPTRAWQLCTGGFLAVLNSKKTRNINKQGDISFFSGFGVLILLLSYLIPSSEGIDFLAVLPTIGAFLVIKYSSQKDFFGRLLGNKVMVLIGKMSYSLYLWHWPIIVFFKKYYNHKLDEIEANFLSIVFTIIFASLSYYLVEKKTRKNNRTQYVVLGGVLLGVLFSLLISSSILEKRYKTKFDKVVFYGLSYDIKPKIEKISPDNLEKRKGVIAPLRKKEYEMAYKKEGILVGNVDLEYPEIIVLGDSHGAMWAKTIHEITDEINTKTSFYTSVGVIPFFPLNRDKIINVKGFSKKQRIEYVESLLNNVNLWNPKIVIISCRWENMSDNNWNYFKDFTNYLSDNSSTKIIVLNQPPVIDIMGDKNTAQYFSYLKRTPNGDAQYLNKFENDRVIEKNERLKRFSIKNTNINYFDAFSIYMKTEGIFIIQGKKINYYDDDHLSYQGTSIAKELLKKEIKKSIN